MRISNKITCVFFIGLLFFAFAGCDHSTSSSSESNSGTPTTPTYIGTKAPGEAKEVGDIVFKDGSASPSSEEFTDAQKAAAVAVIFDETNKLGVGLNTTRKEWCSTSATAYSTRYAASSNNGKANTDEIADLNDYNADNYPAFYFCTTYSAAGFTSGWYLPAIDELIKLYDNKDAVVEAFTALGKSNPFTGIYSDLWWSSYLDSYVDSKGRRYIVIFDFDKGGRSYVIADEGNTLNACAIREF